MRKSRVGEKYGKYTITSDGESVTFKSGQKKRLVDVLCDCGTPKKVFYSNLRKGATKSCGCLHANPIWSDKEATQQWFREYYLKNREKMLSNAIARGAEYKRKKKKEDPAFKLACILRSRIRTALKRKSKRGSAVKLLGCTTQEAVCYIEKQFKQGMTWDNWSLHGWHIDHIDPLSAFDLTDPKQLAEACHYTNLQPLWAQDNYKKGGVRKNKRNEVNN